MSRGTGPYLLTLPNNIVFDGTHHAHDLLTPTWLTHPETNRARRCLICNNIQTHYASCTRKLGKCRSSEGLRSFIPSKGTNLLILIILAGDIEMNPGPRSQCRLCKKYCKASVKSVKCRHVIHPRRQIGFSFPNREND